MEIIEQIERALYLGYSITISPSEVYNNAKIIVKDIKTNHTEEQYIPKDNHLKRLGEFIKFCTDKMNEKHG